MRSYQQPRGVAMVHRLSIFTRLGCRNVNEITGTLAKFGVTCGQSTPIVVDLKLHEFGKNEPDFDEPFRSLVGHLMELANQTRPDILNAVRAVARYSATPK